MEAKRSRYLNLYMPLELGGTDPPTIHAHPRELPTNEGARLTQGELTDPYGSPNQLALRNLTRQRQDCDC